MNMDTMHILYIQYEAMQNSNKVLHKSTEPLESGNLVTLVRQHLLLIPGMRKKGPPSLLKGDLSISRFNSWLQTVHLRGNVLQGCNRKTTPVMSDDSTVLALQHR